MSTLPRQNSPIQDSVELSRLRKVLKPALENAYQVCFSTRSVQDIIKDKQMENKLP